MTLLEEEVMTDEDLRRDLRIEGLLKDWSLDFTFEPEQPLRKIDAGNDESQVREPGHRAPHETTEEYATQMRNGALFPPIVVTHNGRLIDGNTRVAAARQLAIDTFPTYVVRLPQGNYGPMIGAALNQMGGKRLSAEEAFAAAEVMMRAGFADEAIARTLGRSPQAVRNYRREHRYKLTAERTGTASLPIKRQAQRHLADIGHDEPFRAASELVAAAKPAAKDVQEMVEKVNAARSEHEEIQVVEEHRAKWKPTGPPPQRRAPIRAATAAGRKVDALLAITDPVSELAPAQLRGDLEPKWQRLRDLCDRVLAAFADGPAEQEPPSE
jgi:ParB-like chromosome segregation protein Spo0J